MAISLKIRAWRLKQGAAADIVDESYALDTLNMLNQLPSLLLYRLAFIRKFRHVEKTQL